MTIEPTVAAIEYAKQSAMLNDPAKWHAVAHEFEHHTKNAWSGICFCFEMLYGTEHYWACCSFFKLIRDGSDYVWPATSDFRQDRATFCRQVAALLNPQLPENNEP